MQIDPHLIAAMNGWRADQDPPLPPHQAILALLQKGLASEGYWHQQAPKGGKTDGDALAQAFQSYIADNWHGR
jgi:hypothetical protein